MHDTRRLLGIVHEETASRPIRTRNIVNTISFSSNLLKALLARSYAPLALTIALVQAIPAA